MLVQFRSLFFLRALSDLDLLNPRRVGRLLHVDGLSLGNLFAGFSCLLRVKRAHVAPPLSMEAGILSRVGSIQKLLLLVNDAAEVAISVPAYCRLLHHLRALGVEHRVARVGASVVASSTLTLPVQQEFIGHGNRVLLL